MAHVFPRTHEVPPAATSHTSPPTRPVEDTNPKLIDISELPDDRISSDRSIDPQLTTLRDLKDATESAKSAVQASSGAERAPATTTTTAPQASSRAERAPATATTTAPPALSGAERAPATATATTTAPPAPSYPSYKPEELSATQAFYNSASNRNIPANYADMSPYADDHRPSASKTLYSTGRSTGRREKKPRPPANDGSVIYQRRGEPITDSQSRRSDAVHRPDSSQRYTGYSGARDQEFDQQRYSSYSTQQAPPQLAHPEQPQYQPQHFTDGYNQAPVHGYEPHAGGSPSFSRHTYQAPQPGAYDPGYAKREERSATARDNSNPVYNQKARGDADFVEPESHDADPAGLPPEQYYRSQPPSSQYAASIRSIKTSRTTDTMRTVGGSRMSKVEKIKVGTRSIFGREKATDRIRKLEHLTIKMGEALEYVGQEVDKSQINELRGYNKQFDKLRARVRGSKDHHETKALKNGRSTELADDTKTSRISYAIDNKIFTDLVKRENEALEAKKPKKEAIHTDPFQEVMTAIEDLRKSFAKLQAKGENEFLKVQQSGEAYINQLEAFSTRKGTQEHDDVFA
jgi:hypothetical protein